MAEVCLLYVRDYHLPQIKLSEVPVNQRCEFDAELSESSGRLEFSLLLQNEEDTSVEFVSYFVVIPFLFLSFPEFKLVSVRFWPWNMETGLPRGN